MKACYAYAMDSVLKMMLVQTVLLHILQMMKCFQKMQTLENSALFQGLRLRELRDVAENVSFEYISKGNYLAHEEVLAHCRQRQIFHKGR